MNFIITGASRGIGRGIATVFAKNGCSVAFTYNNNKEMADSLQKELARIFMNPINRIRFTLLSKNLLVSNVAY